MARQGACQALAALAPTCRGLIDRAEPDDVEEYLHSNWIVPTSTGGLARFVAGHWRVGWRADYLTSVEKGRRRLADLLAVSAELRAMLEQSGARMLQDLGLEIGETVDSPLGVQLARLARRPGRGRLVFDRLARHDGKGMLATLLKVLGTVEALWSLGVTTEEHGCRRRDARGRHPAGGAPRGAGLRRLAHRRGSPGPGRGPTRPSPPPGSRRRGRRAAFRPPPPGRVLHPAAGDGPPQARGRAGPPGARGPRRGVTLRRILTPRTVTEAIAACPT